MANRHLSKRARSAATLALLGAALASCSSHGGDLTLTTVSPAQISARGGAPMTLQGTGFADGAEVRLGDVPVSALKVASASELTFTAPPLFAGAVDVKVSTADGRSAELANGVEVLRLDLRFVEAPPYALPSAPGGDGGAPDGGASDGGAPDVGSPGTVTGAALADFDGDGHPDLITCAAGEACRFLANDGQGNFTDQPGHFPAATPDTRALLAADFDGDGDLDLFLGVGTGGPGVVYQNQGQGIFVDVGPGALPAGAGSFSAAAAGDLDGDGLPDLVIGGASADGTPLRVYVNAGKSDPLHFTAAAGAAPAADWVVSAIALADFDGDGSLDVLVATTSPEEGIALRLLHNDGGALHEVDAGLPAHLPGAIRALAAGDVSGDGAADLVVSGDGQDRLFLNDGTGHFFDATVASMPLDDSPGTSIALVDLDRDRHLDLVIGNDRAQTRLYLNDGAGHFSDHTPLLPIVADPTVWVGVADVNGDSASDVLVINATPTPANLYLSVEPLPNDTP
jgi:hypothetical protein